MGGMEVLSRPYAGSETLSLPYMSIEVSLEHSVHVTVVLL
jgi:hypothetical protein